MLSFPDDRAIEIIPISGKSDKPYIVATAAYFHDAYTGRRRVGGREWSVKLSRQRNYIYPWEIAVYVHEVTVFSFVHVPLVDSFQFRVMQPEVGARSVIHWRYYGLNFSLYNEGEMPSVEPEWYYALIPSTVGKGFPFSWNISATLTTVILTTSVNYSRLFYRKK